MTKVFHRSIFDSVVCGDPRQFWLKDFSDIKPKIEQAPILYEGYLKKKVRKLVSYWVTRYYVLYPNYLVYYKNESKTQIKGVLELYNVRLDKEINQGDKYFCLRLVKNEQFCDLCTSEEHDYELWRQEMSKCCVNTDFHEKYNPIKMIGRGTFAKVYLIENKTNKRKYAVKAFCKEKLLQSKNNTAGLVREIQILRELDHKQIIRLYEVHETVNSVYMVFEVLTGGDLLSRINAKGKYSLEDAMMMMKNLLEALDYCHMKKIMHRDLKPENIILASDLNNYDIKLVDFGLADFEGREHSTYLFTRCGTPGFVAPEVFKGDEKMYNSRCDVFSAGVIFIMLLTGKNPFRSGDIKEVMMKNKECKLDFTAPPFANLNELALDLMRKMLSPDPLHRMTCKEALSHPFFKIQGPDVKSTSDILGKPMIPLLRSQDSDADTGGNSGDSNRFNSENQRLDSDGQSGPPSDPGSIPISRTPLIMGRVDTVEGSFQGSISSVAKLRAGSESHGDNTPSNIGQTGLSRFCSKLPDQSTSPTNIPRKSNTVDEKGLMKRFSVNQNSNLARKVILKQAQDFIGGSFTPKVRFSADFTSLSTSQNDDGDNSPRDEETVKATRNLKFGIGGGNAKNDSDESSDYEGHLRSADNSPVSLRPGPTDFSQASKHRSQFESFSSRLKAVEHDDGVEEEAK